MKIQKNRTDGFEFNFSSKAQQLLKKPPTPQNNKTENIEKKTLTGKTNNVASFDDKKSNITKSNQSKPTEFKQVFIANQNPLLKAQLNNSVNTNQSNQLISPASPTEKTTHTIIRSKTLSVPNEPPINIFTSNATTNSTNNVQTSDLQELLIETAKPLGKRKIYFDPAIDAPQNMNRQSKGNNFDAQA